MKGEVNMCDSIDKNLPLMKPTFFAEDDVNNPKNKNNKKAEIEDDKNKEMSQKP